MSARRIRAMFRKELREYRRNGFIVSTMAITPVGFLVFPLLFVINVPSPSSSFRLGSFLLYLLGIPALVPAVVASYAVVGERLQGTLEPVLTTPIRREELILGKALASFVPSLVVSYGVYAFFLSCVLLYAHPGVASALIEAR